MDEAVTKPQVCNQRECPDCKSIWQSRAMLHKRRRHINRLLDMIQIRERSHVTQLQEMRAENKCLAGRKPLTVYRETEATQEKLRLNAETIQSLKRACRHHANAFRGQLATIDEQTKTIEGLKALVKSYEGSLDSAETTDRILRAKIVELRGMAEAAEEEVQTLDVRLREHKWLIDTYREKHAVMVEKIDKLTPELECDEDDPPIDEAQRPDDMGAGSGPEVLPRTWGTVIDWRAKQDHYSHSCGWTVYEYADKSATRCLRSVARGLTEEDARRIVRLLELEAIVDKLPKTKDGVRVVPSGTTTVYYIHPKSGGVCQRPYMADLDDYWSHRDPNNDVVWRGIEDCYSTHEAAEAARKEAGS